MHSFPPNTPGAPTAGADAVRSKPPAASDDARPADADDALCWLPAHDLARRVAAREVSPVEVMQAMLRRAAHVDPHCRVFAHFDADRALEAARQAEQAVMRGDRLGPLHGVPITVKDNIAVAGVPLRHGSAALDGAPAAADAQAWRRLREAGAVLLGKTTLPEFAHKVLTDSAVHGITRNPWRLDRTPGGSSGGAAAAVAAGLGPLALGTDGGGSIRVPAACTGLVGLKPTLGRVPNESLPDTFGGHSHIGPLARDAVDADLMLAVLAGPHPDDALSLRSAAYAHDAHALQAPPRHLRIGWIAQVGDTPVDADVHAACEAALLALQQAGVAVVEPMAAPALRHTYADYALISSAGMAARLHELRATRGTLLTPTLSAALTRVAAADAQRLAMAVQQRTVLFRAVQAMLHSHDLLAMPTLTRPAVSVHEEGSVFEPFYQAWCAASFPFNQTGHPAISIPCGFSAEGLPIGLQLVGRWHAERLLLRLAQWLQSAASTPPRRPTLAEGAEPTATGPHP
jgi:aspartyl-tRNA(Asn)/glutamyl-tRNA(Gln) amidotransferase subunit A